MLVSREFTFAGAHRLPGYDGKCERLHGHTWRLRVTVSAAIGANGIAFDFKELGHAVEERVLSVLDHADHPNVYFCWNSNRPAHSGSQNSMLTTVTLPAHNNLCR